MKKSDENKAILGIPRPDIVNRSEQSRREADTRVSKLQVREPSANTAFNGAWA